MLWLSIITSQAVPNPFVMDAKYTISMTSLVCCREEGEDVVEDGS